MELGSHNLLQSHCYYDDFCPWSDEACWGVWDSSSLPGLSPWRKRMSGFNVISAFYMQQM